MPAIVLGTFRKKGFFFFLIYFLIIATSSYGQCISTGYNNGSTFTTQNPGGAFNFDFSNPGNAAASDNVRATASSILALLVGDTYYLKATGFGFTIPSYASICGITVQIERRAQGLGLFSSITDNEVKLIKGGTITGNDKGSASTWATSDVTTTYGNSSDLWGITLTPADVNASDFGVAISVHINGIVVVPSAEIDNIRMNIYYNPALPTHLISFTSSLKNNIAHIEWKTADEEDHEFITLQRSVVGQSQWVDISRFEMQTGNNGKQYSYDDALTEKGNYYYRLQITLASRQTILSEIKEIKFTQTGIISIYPNPAGYYIILNNIQNLEKINITNLYLQQFKLPVEKTGNTSCRINIQQLPKGVYIVIAGSQKIRFLKE